MSATLSRLIVEKPTTLPQRTSVAGPVHVLRRAFRYFNPSNVSLAGGRCIAWIHVLVSSPIYASFTLFIFSSDTFPNT